MKKQILTMAMMAAVMMTAGAMMTACSNDLKDDGMTENPTTISEPTKVTLTFSPYDMTAMTRGGDSETEQQGMGSGRRALTRAAVADFATRLDVWIYQGGQEVQAVHQQKTDDGFASLSVTLDKTKTYTLYAVAHKGTDVATLANGVVSFPNDKVTHTFFYTSTFSPSETTTLSCQMERIVGNFQVETTDQTPTGAKDLELHIGSSPTAWNVAGYGVQPQDRTATFANVSPRSDGTLALSCFIIAEAEEAVNYDITLIAYDGSHAIVQQRTFSDVPIRNGYKTLYRGAFFTNQDFTASFTATDWQEFDVTTF